MLVKNFNLYQKEKSALICEICGLFYYEIHHS
jgi:hypothetical protein